MNEQTVMIQIIRYCCCWLVLLLLLVFDDGCRRHSNNNENGGSIGDGGGFGTLRMIEAYNFLLRSPNNNNIYRYASVEIPISFRSSRSGSIRTTKHPPVSFVRQSSTLHSSTASDDTNDVDVSVERPLVSDSSDTDVTSNTAAMGSSSTTTTSTLTATSSLLSPLIEPTSDTAKELCRNTLHMTQKQYEQILHFVTLIMEWNERLNLISRKDCTPTTIFTRHILPSLVGGRIIQQQQLTQLAQLQSPPIPSDDTTHPTTTTIRIIDVGTGGGFPGIPLAIQYPQIQFVLADSIQKKIAAVQNIIDQLQLTNVNTYHGRVEEYCTTTGEDVPPKFDIVTGRSVTALPQFCSWIKDVVKEDGHLVYWIGGPIDEMIQEYMIHNISIQEHLSESLSESSANIWNDNFDKRVLIVPASGIQTIAALIPESQFQQQLSKSVVAVTTRRKPSTSSSLRSRDNHRDFTGSSSNTASKNNNVLAKGEWRKRNDPDQPKQRGYENFQRFTSSSKIPKPKSNSNSETDSGPESE